MVGAAHFEGIPPDVGVALRAEGLESGYPGLELFRALDLELRRGEVRALLGPSGSGKSTLIHLLAGILRPQAGLIYWADTEITTRGEAELDHLRRHHVALVFQHHYLLPELSALENVLLPGKITGREDLARATDLLTAVGLSGRQSLLPGALSGGERQRVAVARAVYPAPTVILADEPTGSLDPRHARGVLDLLLALATQNDSAVLLATHDQRLVEDLPHWYLYDGRVWESPQAE